jgi:peptide/nickel transport system substrate-binding protein
VQRKALAIPAAAVVMLSGVGGAGHWSGSAYAKAKVSASQFSGTLSITEYQVPNAMGAGGAAGAAEANQQLIAFTSDSALGIDYLGNFYADLATAIPSTSNGGLKVTNGNEVITFHIKPGLKWSDGSPITAADWIAPYYIGYSTDSASLPGSEDDQISSVTVNGSDLVINIKGVLGSALQQLNPGPDPWEYYQKKYSAPVTGLDMNSFVPANVIDPKTDNIKASLYASSGLKKLATTWNSDNYTSPNDLFDGPYKIQSWSPDQRYVFAANPYYTALPAAPGHPRPAIIQEVVLSETGTTYIQDLKAASTYSEIDSANDFTPDNITDLQQTKYQVANVPGLEYEHLDFNVAPTYNGAPNPVADVRVRTALNYAINKFEYLKALSPAENPQVLSLASLIPASSPWSINSQLPQNPYSPAKAMALLKAAGYATSLNGSGKHLVLDYATTSKASRIKSAGLLQRYFALVGVSLKVHILNATGSNGLFSSWSDGGVLEHHSFQLAEFAYLENPDPDEGSLNYLPAQISTAANPNGVNYQNVNDATLTKLWLQGRNSLDMAARMKTYAQVQKYFYQQMFSISLFTDPEIYLFKGTVGNAKADRTQNGPWWNAFQMWVDPTNSQKIITQ